MIYENIDKGMYDLSSEKSGIRVGNESYQVTAGGGAGSGMGAASGSTKLGKDNTAKQSSGGCCSWEHFAILSFRSLIYCIINKAWNIISKELLLP